MVIRTLSFVAAGGALEAVARYLLSSAVHSLWPMRFPLATRGQRGLVYWRGMGCHNNGAADMDGVRIDG